MSKRILIIDQSRTIQTLLSTYFKNGGHQVIAQSTPQQALQVLETLRDAPDMIFLALHIDEKAAYQVIRYVKGWATYDHTELVVMVSQEDKPHIERTLTHITIHYLVKPFHIRQALAFVGRDNAVLHTNRAIGNGPS